MSILPSTLPSSTHTPLRGGATLRWGILAPGRIAHDWATTVHANTDQRVVAVASRSAERAAAFAATHGVERSYGQYEALVGAHIMFKDMSADPYLLSAGIWTLTGGPSTALHLLPFVSGLIQVAVAFALARALFPARRVRHERWPCQCRAGFLCRRRAGKRPRMTE